MKGVREDRFTVLFLRDLSLVHGWMFGSARPSRRRGVNNEKLFVSIHFFSLGPTEVLLYCEGCEHCVAFCVGTWAWASVTSDGLEVRYCAVLFLTAWLADVVILRFRRVDS
jgi:hypothetical protein